MKRSAADRQSAPRLSTLFGLDGGIAFMREPWPRAPLCHQGPVERLPLAHKLVKGAAHELITRQQPLGVAYADRDGHLRIRERLPYGFARGLYDRGYAIALHQLQTSELIDSDWILGLMAELALPVRLDSVSISGLLSSARYASGVHREDTPSMIAQVRGSQSIDLSGAQSGEHDGGHDDGHDGEHDGAHGWTMTPGDVLYLPERCEHVSSADGESLCLRFVFHTRPWVDVLIDWLGERLPARGAWSHAAKQIAPGAGPGAERSGRCQELVRDLFDVMSDEPVVLRSRGESEHG